MPWTPAVPPDVDLNFYDDRPVPSADDVELNFDPGVSLAYFPLTTDECSADLEVSLLNPVVVTVNPTTANVSADMEGSITYQFTANITATTECTADLEVEVPTVLTVAATTDDESIEVNVTVLNPRTATINPTTANCTFDIHGTYTVPSYDATIALTAANSTGDMQVTVLNPRTATISKTTDDCSFDIHGTYTKPHFDATIDLVCEDCVAFMEAYFNPHFEATLDLVVDDATGDLEAQFIPITFVDINPTTESPVFDFFVYNWPTVSDGTIEATTDGCSVDLVMLRVIIAWRGTFSYHDSSYQEAMPFNLQEGFPWIMAPVVHIPRISFSWDLMEVITPTFTFSYGDFPVMDFHENVIWGPFGSEFNPVSNFRFSDNPEHKDFHEVFPVDSFGDRFNINDTFGFSNPAVKDVHWLMPWNALEFFFTHFTFPFHDGITLRFRRKIPWGMGTPINVQLRGPRTKLPLIPPWHWVRSTDLIFSEYLTHSPNFQLHPTITRDSRSVTLQDNVTMKELASGEFIRILTLNLSTDRNSWCWKLNASVQIPEHFLLLAPNESFQKKVVEVAINGYPVWRFLIEDLTRNLEFTGDTYSVSGRSQSIVLADPFAAKRTYVEHDSKSLAQLAEDQLVDTGWTVEFDSDYTNMVAIDWVVPGNTWTVNNQTPVETLGSIASAIGARLISHKSDLTLLVIPTYRVSPWNYSDLTVDFDADAEIMVKLGERNNDKPGYDGYWMSGTLAGGVVVHAKRVGTAGAWAPQLEVNPLFTHVPGCAERGRQVLCAGGYQSLISIALPVFEFPTNPPLLEPGTTIKIIEGTESWFAFVNSVTINYDGIGVDQTVELERHFY